MRRILAADGHQRSTLALVRSLGKKGIAVSVAEDRHPCLASKSKYCRSRVIYASPEENPLKFIEDIKNELKNNDYDMLIPMTDITCFLANEHAEELSQYTHISMPPPEIYKKAQDKGEVIKLCKSLDVPTPATYFIENLDDAKKLAKSLKYPVVVKPRLSKTLTSNGWVHGSISYAHTETDLIQTCKNWDSSLPLPLIQERIEGPGGGAFLLCKDGEPLAVFFHRRIREKPPSGGVSVLRESVPVDKAMKEYSLKILKALNWQGAAMVEFKLDRRDNLPKIMEINARFWGSLQLGIDAGVDFPYLLYRSVMGEDVQPILDYKAGIKTRWLIGDIDHLLIRLFKSDKNLNLPDGFPGKLAVLKEFFRFFQSGMKYEILNRDDLKPALYELYEYLKNIIKGILGKLRKK
ncbi:MAG: ATP-grasp domain-containing protein [candidate division Zixibacteria bacterium]|nr:ATP-grasp domain-containing protein [candidate division Zixibacteria bacterium]